MTLSAPMRCSALAEQLDEPLAGTADVYRRWLLIEDRSAWGKKAVRDVLGADREAEAKRLGLRVLLVRRREGPPEADATRRTFLIDTVDRSAAVRVVQSLDDVSVSAAAGAPVASFGEAVSQPMFLVCTNGKRDACCALRGRALVAAVAAAQPDRVWECTHLGGHRFAGNLVCLPDGIVYGRVTPVDGPRLADAYLAGRMDLALLRGRTAWPIPAQVAEHALRSHLGLHGLADVRLERTAINGDRASVVLRTESGTYAFRLHADRLPPPRPTSCGGHRLEEPIHWRATSRVTIHSSDGG